MTRIRRSVAMLVALAALTFPLKACAGGPAGLPGPGGIAGLALKVGASVGSYLLIKELTD